MPCTGCLYKASDAARGASARPDVFLGGQPPSLRYFFSGEPAWEIGGSLYTQPWGCYRVVEGLNGAIYWVRNGQPVLNVEGSRVWDTYAAF